MPDIGKINGIAVASISKVNDVAIANIGNVNSITKASSATSVNYLAVGGLVSWGQSSGKHGLGRFPTNWDSAVGRTVHTGAVSNRAWSSDTGGTTPSSGTGPTNGHEALEGITGDGRESGLSEGYAFTEATSNFNKHCLLRTPELDFTDSLSNSTLKLYFWFHMFGSNMGDLGVAATDSATSAGDSTLGKHFTSDSAGGLTIVFWDDASDDGSSTSSGVRISGQQQTAGHGSTATAAHWRLAVVDLNDLAGESSVYLWFFGKTGSQFRSDMCIDGVLVKGEE